MNVPLKIEYEYYQNLAEILMKNCKNEEISTMAQEYYKNWHKKEKSFKTDGYKIIDGFFFCVCLIRREQFLINRSLQTGKPLLVNWLPSNWIKPRPVDYCPVLREILSDLHELGIEESSLPKESEKDLRKDVTKLKNLDLQFEQLVCITFRQIASPKNSKYRFKSSQWIQKLLLLPKDASLLDKTIRNETVIFLNYMIEGGKGDRLPNEWDFLWKLPRLETGRRERITNFQEDHNDPKEGAFVFVSFKNFSTP
ncbi:hypothetical protein DMENIID0001_066480 [Sergentomyia squamirostris]